MTLSVISNPLHQKLLLLAVALGVVMDGLDGNIVNVALPTMATYFNTDTGTVAWVIITYLLMMAGLLLFFGKIADRGRMKAILLSGLLVFTLGSAACGLSPELSILLAARIIQGTGAAMIAAVAPLICIRYLPGGMLGLALGVLAASSSFGFAIGPAIGGFITASLSWHWIFLINIPLGILGILFAFRVVPDDEPENDKPPLDYAGAAAFFCAMVSGIYVLTEWPSMGLHNAGIPAALLVFIGSTLFFAYRVARARAPFINAGIFSRWQFPAVLAAFLLINVVYGGILYLIPFYLANGMGFGPEIIGLCLLVPPVITGVLGIPVGRWSDRHGRRGFAIIACVFLLTYSLIFFVLSPAAGMIPLVAALVLMGASFGFAGGPASGRIIDHAPAGEESTASSLMVTSIYFGCVLGTALYAALFTYATASGGVIAFTDLDPAVFLSGFHFATAFGVILSLITLVLSVAVRDARKRA